LRQDAAFAPLWLRPVAAVPTEQPN